MRVTEFTNNQEVRQYACLPRHAGIFDKKLYIKQLQNTPDMPRDEVYL